MIKSEIIVVKIGGATLGQHDTTIDDIVRLQHQGKSLVVVHGGGKVITEWLAKQQVTTRFIQGERVTDKASLEVVVAVLAGLVNKQLVADINSLGGQAVGLSGIDGGIVRAAVKNAELGYVGNIVKVDTAPLGALMKAGYVPVIAPLGLGPAGESNILNINADTVAGEIAAALGATRLIFLTDVAGVNDKAGNLLTRLTPAEAQALIASGVVAGGMIPKVKACLRALPGTANTCIIDGREPHALLRLVEQKGGPGTFIAPPRSD